MNGIYLYAATGAVLEAFEFVANRVIARSRRREAARWVHDHPLLSPDERRIALEVLEQLKEEK